MTGVPERPFEPQKTVPLIEGLRLGHVPERLEVHPVKACTPRAGDAFVEQVLTKPEPTELGQEVHLAKLGRRTIAAFEGSEAAAPNDLSVDGSCHDPIGRPL